MKRILLFLALLTGLADIGSAQIVGPDPQISFRDTDQACTSAGGGMWRWRFNGGVATLELNTAAGCNFSAVTVPVSVSTSGAVTFLSAPVFSSLTQGSVVFAGSGGLLSQDNSNLFWNNSTKRFGIGTSSPTEGLTVVDSGNAHSNSLTFGVYANNLSQGISFGYQGISKVGSSTDSSLYLDAKGTGSIQLQASGVSTGGVVIPGTLYLAAAQNITLQHNASSTGPTFKRTDAAPVSLSLFTDVAGVVNASIGQLKFEGDNSLGSSYNGVLLDAVATNVTSGSETTDLRISTYNLGSLGERLRVAGPGLVTINAPVSGEALNVTGFANNWATRVVGSGTSGQSFGTKIQAGTNSSDTAFNVTEVTNTTNYFQVRGDGASRFQGALAAGVYKLLVLAESGADRDVFAAQVNTASNGFTVRYVSSAMQYVFNNGQVGIGTPAPTTFLTVSANTQTLPSAVVNGTAAIGHFGSANGTTARVLVDSFGSNNSQISLRTTSGTASAPAATQLDTGIGNIAGYGYGTTGYSTTSRARMDFNAAENWTDANQGAYIAFYTTPIGSTTIAERMRILANGNVGINNTGPTHGLQISSVVTNGAVLQIDGTSTGIGTQIVRLLGTAIAVQNSQSLYGAYIIPTFAKGSFTGLTAYGVVVDGSNMTATGGGTIDNTYALVVGAMGTGVSNYAAQFTAGPVLFSNGGVGSPSIAWDTHRTTGIYKPADSQIAFTLGATGTALLSTGGFNLVSTAGLNWLSGDITTSADVKLVRKNAGILALENGANAQEFRVTGTTTGPAYVRIGADATQGFIGTVSDLPFNLFSNNGARYWQITTSAGNYSFVPSGTTQDIGTTALQVRSYYGNTSVNVGQNLATNATGVVYANSNAASLVIVADRAADDASALIINARRGRGNQGALTRVLSGDTIVSFLGTAYSGSGGYLNTASIQYVVDDVTVDGQRPASRIEEYTNVNNGAQTLRHTLFKDGANFWQGDAGANWIFNQNKTSTGTFQIRSNSNDNHFKVGFSQFGNAGSFAFGSDFDTQVYMVVNPPALTAGTNLSYYRFGVSNSSAVTIPAGTAPVVASLVVTEPNIIATGTVTDAYSLYVANEPTEGTRNGAIWGIGAHRFQGNIFNHDFSTLGYFIEGRELSGDPSAPAADRFRLFAKDNGAGKTQLCVIFNSGAAQCFATQP